MSLIHRRTRKPLSFLLLVLSIIALSGSRARSHRSAVRLFSWATHTGDT